MALRRIDLSPARRGRLMIRIGRNLSSTDAIVVPADLFVMRGILAWSIRLARLLYLARTGESGGLEIPVLLRGDLYDDQPTPDRRKSQARRGVPSTRVGASAVDSVGDLPTRPTRTGRGVDAPGEKPGPVGRGKGRGACERFPLRRPRHRARENSPR